MTEYIVQDTSLTAVANKIREKTGGVAPLEFPDEFIAEIDNISPAPPTTPTDSIIFYSRTPFSLYIQNKQWNGSLYYSVDGSNWQELQNAVVYNAELNDHWYTLYIRGESNTVLSTGGSGAAWALYGANIHCAGNMNNVLDHTQVITSISSKAFAYVFYNCSTVDFDISLPALQINSNAYQSMFQGCKSMIKAPDLPATILGSTCYRDMFYGCEALTDIPDILPATTVPQNGYDRMFGDCYSLKKCPKLPATTLAVQCYVSMFQNCRSLEQIPKLPAVTLKNYCYTTMFSGCSKIKLSETQSDGYQTPYRIPSTGTGTDATSTMNNMFLQTGGTFTGDPTINTTYYTSNAVIPAT